MLKRVIQNLRAMYIGIHPSLAYSDTALTDKTGKASLLIPSFLPLTTMDLGVST